MTISFQASPPGWSPQMSPRHSADPRGTQCSGRLERARDAKVCGMGDRSDLNDFECSCVIPTHGRPSFLEEALDSVIAQTHPVKEIIVVSDDDNQESRAVVASAASRAAMPITLIRNTGASGASASRNLGAANVSTPWIAFLDDDDLWAETYLADTIAVTEGNDFVVTWLEMFRDGATSPGQRIVSGLTAGDVGGRGHGFIGSNFIIRREAFDRIGGFDADLPVLNDRDFFYRALRSRLTYAVVTEPNVLHRRHDEGQLTQLTERRAAGMERYLEKHATALRWSEKRETRMVIHRIRYHATRSRVAKLKHMVLALCNASPRNFVESLKTHRASAVWHKVG